MPEEKNNHYTTAVNNLENLVDFVEDTHPDLPDEMFQHLRYGIFYLKLQKEYQIPDEPVNEA
jgi:hypothetical protein